MGNAARFVALGGVFLLTLIPGFLLSRSGTPYNSILFNLHKLLALAAVVVTAVQLHGIFMVMKPDVFSIALLVFAGLAIVALFATGALMSAGKPAYRLLRTVHNIAPFVAIIGLVLAVYLHG